MATNEEFSQFVKNKNQKKQEEINFDPKKELEDWKRNLKELYEKIEGFLSSYIADGSIKIEHSNIHLTEDQIGSYEVQNSIITIGSEKVTLTPVGTLLVGTKGRVDVEGGSGTSRLVLINKKITRPEEMIRISVQVIPPSGHIQKTEEPTPIQEDIQWVWKIVGRYPHLHFIDLNKENFLKLLMEVNNV
ncbi:hypothetical protein ACWM9A_12550 [Acetobacter pasteurianus]|jgi:hypothetical protein|nr:hypothetical protein [Acetobacter peroxydans]